MTDSAPSKTMDHGSGGYGFVPGRVLASKYEIVSHVGTGDESELYMLAERATGIERTAKFFSPQSNPGGRRSSKYARKLHKLRDCDILTQYHTQETIRFQGRDVTFLVSEFVEGQLLSDFLGEQPGGRLSLFEGLHLLYALSKGLEQIHRLGEFHGDLQVDNIAVRRRGLGFAVKLLDLGEAPLGWQTGEMIREDVCDLLRIFYDIIGGSRFYAKHPQEIKSIISGLKRSLIREKFRNAGSLRSHLETMRWY